MDSAREGPDATVEGANVVVVGLNATVKGPTPIFGGGFAESDDSAAETS
jgi:hypothetical protein